MIFEEAENVSQIACGSRHTLFLCCDGSVYSCGHNESGQLAQGKRYDSLRKELKPSLVKNLKNLRIIQVAAGFSHSLALTDSGHLYSWGSNSHGQIGAPKLVKNGSSVCSPMEVNISEVIQIACGGNFSLALTSDGSLYSWGENDNGQLGLGNTVNQNTPQVVRSLNGVPLYQIEAGNKHACAVSESGAVFTWGANTYGQLGVADVSKDRLYPTHVKVLRTLGVRFLACGDGHTAVLTLSGRVLTFGADTYGQLGHGKRVNEFSPKQVFELMGSKVTRIACGRCHTLSVVGGKLYSFGLGSEGQLGNGKRNNILVPSLVKFPGEVRNVFAGGDRVHS